MTEEIKEIIDDLGNKDSYVNDITMLTFDEGKMIKDYITNLQQENETLKAKLEIGKTCGFCPYYDYKSRCQKAVEYIKMYKCDYSPYELTDSAIRNVLNILKGSDEND